ncbi:MAG: MOSC domain-containing protein, partial [Verrucomicrobiota bacterium]
MTHLTTSEFEEKLPEILNAPKKEGVLTMIVIRPRENERTILDRCLLSASGGAEGDNWAQGCWKTLPDGSPHPDVQLTLMNSRVMDAIEANDERKALAGDNLYIDF